MADNVSRTRVAPLTRLWHSRYGRFVRYRAKRGLQRLSTPWRRGPDCCVFVAGVQRSGTNMVMDALERSWATDVIHESDPRGFDGYEMRGTAVVGRLAQRSPARVFVIKALCELQDLPELMDRLDPARTIWVYRDYRDVANSMAVSFKSVPDTVHRIAEQGNAAGWWSRGMTDETLKFVQGAVTRGLDPHSSAALLWYIRNRLYFDRGLSEDERVHLVRYEELVTDPVSVLNRIATFAGLPPRTGLARGIHPRSIGRRSPPNLDGAVENACDQLMAEFDRHRSREQGAKTPTEVAAG